MKLFLYIILPLMAEDKGQPGGQIHTCGHPCTVMGMAAWGCVRDTLTGTAGVSVWTAGAGASTDATCCSADAAGAQPGLVPTHI